MKLILGSGSRYRKMEFEKAGFVFDVLAADIDEKAIRSEDYYNLSLLIAHAKHDALIPQIVEPSYLITLDSVVVCNGQLIEKPVSLDEVKGWTKLYEQFPIDIITGVVVSNTKTGKRTASKDVASMVWGAVDQMILDEILAKTNMFECAGFNMEMVEAFAVQRDSTDRLRGAPIELIQRLIKEVE